MSDETGRRLAELIGHPPRPKTRAMFGTVTQVAPLLVHPEGARAGVVIGPCALVRNAPKVGEQVPLLELPEQAMWVAIGGLAAMGDLTVVWDDITGMFYVRRVGGAWTAPARAPGTDANDIEPACAPNALYEDLPAMAEPSTIYPDIANGWDDASDTNRIFRLSDGSVVAVVFLNSHSPFFTVEVAAIRRRSDGVWQAPIPFRDVNDGGQVDTSVMCRSGDTLYGLLWIGYGGGYGGDMVPCRVDLAGGVLTTTIGPNLPEFRTAPNDLPIGAYYDSTNGLVHYLYWDSDQGVTSGNPNTQTGILRMAAVNPATLATVYSATLATDLVATWYAAQGALCGDGGGTMYVYSILTHAQPPYGQSPYDQSPHVDAWRVTAGPAGYTIVLEQVPAPPIQMFNINAVWDGAGVTLVVGSGGGTAGINALRRLGTYEAAWTRISGAYPTVYWSLSTCAAGANARVAYRRQPFPGILRELVIP